VPTLQLGVKVAIEEMTNVKGSLIRRLFPDKAFIAQVKQLSYGLLVCKGNVCQ